MQPHLNLHHLTHSHPKPQPQISRGFSSQNFQLAVQYIFVTFLLCSNFAPQLLLLKMCCSFADVQILPLNCRCSNFAAQIFLLKFCHWLFAAQFYPSCLFRLGLRLVKDYTLCLLIIKVFFSVLGPWLSDAILCLHSQSHSGSCYYNSCHLQCWVWSSQTYLEI